MYAVLNSSVKVQCLSPYYQSVFFPQAQYVNKTENSLSTSIINVREMITLFIHQLVHSICYTKYVPCIFYFYLHLFPTLQMNQV